MEEAARRYVVAVTEEDFPSRFPSGVVLGGPWGFPNYGAIGPLTDQGAYSPVTTPTAYTLPELQQEAAHVPPRRGRSLSAPRSSAKGCVEAVTLPAGVQQQQNSRHDK